MRLRFPSARNRISSAANTNSPRMSRRFLPNSGFGLRPSAFLQQPGRQFSKFRRKIESFAVGRPARGPFSQPAVHQLRSKRSERHRRNLRPVEIRVLRHPRWETPTASASGGGRQGAALSTALQVRRSHRQRLQRNQHVEVARAKTFQVERHAAEAERT